MADAEVLHQGVVEGLAQRGEPDERWHAASSQIPRNAPVNPQVDDGHPIGEAGCGFEVTSSASMPAVVAGMLAALQVEPGMRVLEIGTGTGYNAALLAHRLGAGNVVSVEVDPAVATHARRALAAAGFGGVRVVSADGAQGYLPQAPYDRVISTVAVTEVPPAWVAQTCPGGWCSPVGHPVLPGRPAGAHCAPRGHRDGLDRRAGVVHVAAYSMSQIV